MKKIHLLCLLGLALLFPNFLSAQDLTRELMSASNSTIIRQWKADKWLCYNRGKGNEFYAVSTTGSTTPYMTLENDSITITDFEIFDDTVYFCGYKDSTTRIAMMGYFPLTTFPNSIVKYNTLSDVVSFNKMDVFSAEGQVHVEMTATLTYGEVHAFYTIVDARENSDGSWMYYVLDKPEKGLIFDDVAVTDSFVVFTGRSLRDDNYEAFNTTELWYFYKPTMYGVPVFLTSVDIRCLYNWPVGQVIIEHLFADIFIIALRKGSDVIVSSFYHGLSYNTTCKLILDDSIDTREVLDVKYNKSNSRYDILACRQNNEMLTSRIFTIPLTNHYNPSGTVQMRTFRNKEIQSIDFLSLAPNQFVASGHNNTSNLIVCKYDQLLSGNCFDLSTVESKQVLYNRRPIKKNISVKIYRRTMQYIPTEDHNIETETRCD